MRWLERRLKQGERRVYYWVKKSNRRYKVLMIRRVTIRKFKRFREQTFELAESVVLAGPNNAGKSTLLQAIATWKLGIDRWLAQREGGRAVRRSGVAITRADFTAVPLREMNLLWEGRKVTGTRGMSGTRRLIEIVVEGGAGAGEEEWTCGVEFQYSNPEVVHVASAAGQRSRPGGHSGVPPFGGPGPSTSSMSRLSPVLSATNHGATGGCKICSWVRGRPGEILRNLLWEIFENSPENWRLLAEHICKLFRIEVLAPSYAPAQPYIVCEYREPGRDRPLDLSNAGSGTLQVLLLLAFLYARPAAVILLDEPDAHQHVILQRQVYDLIRKVARERGGQVLIATHSEVILDATEPTRVLGFFGESPRPLVDQDQRNQLREALKRLTTTDLLLGREVGAVLYVESETDERILG